MMTLSERGEAFIKGFEKLRLRAYRNFPNEPWTAGFGHTGKDVNEDTICNGDQAETWFQCDLAGPERAVNLMTAPKMMLTQNRFDALVSFAFNVGVAAEGHSTLVALFNDGNIQGAAAEFLKWDHVDGKEVFGLLTRRRAERALFLS